MENNIEINSAVESKRIGSVIADDVSPSFDVFRFKANANEYVFPGTLVATYVSSNKFLVGRISGSIEINPHESASRAKAVRWIRVFRVEKGSK